MGKIHKMVKVPKILKSLKEFTLNLLQVDTVYRAHTAFKGSIYLECPKKSKFATTKNMKYKHKTHKQCIYFVDFPCLKVYDLNNFVKGIRNCGLISPFLFYINMAKCQHLFPKPAYLERSLLNY